MIKDIESINNKLPELKKSLRDHNDKLDELIEKIRTTIIDISTIDMLDDDIYKEKYKLEEYIDYIQSEINKIENNEHLNDYFIKTGHLLYDYYDGSNTLEKEYQSAKDLESEDSSNEDGYDTEDSNGSENVKRATLGNAIKKTKITDFIEKEKGFEKAELYDKYIKLINNQTFIQKDIFMKKSQVGQSAICPKCNIGLTLVHSEGLQVCNQCGVTEYILIDSEKPSFREPPPEVSYFAYKRINHFNEWLSQFQAKESTEIPQEIYQLILLEMKKERIIDLNKITHTKIREYLKKLKLNKYYEHIPHILNKLNKKVPLISKEVEEKLRHMFKEIQAPFMKICPPNRKNFLSYSYVLHKFVELLGLDHLKEGFPLLKSREKLHQQDQMWKEICKELNWMFIKSI
jgi:ribosomal protein S27AE